MVLTGATGFLGAFIYEALLRRQGLPEAPHIMLLVRAPNDAAAQIRVRDSMQKYGLRNYDESRVEVVAASLDSQALGLGRVQYHALAARCRYVIHCAAHVSGAAPYEALKGSNVDGTRRLLALALLGQDKDLDAGVEFVHVSTMGFVPMGGAETRDVADTGIVVTQSGYAQSKCRSESVLRGRGQPTHAHASACLGRGGRTASFVGRDTSRLPCTSCPTRSGIWGLEDRC